MFNAFTRKQAAALSLSVLAAATVVSFPFQALASSQAQATTAAATSQNGKKHFLRCNACHSVEANNTQTTGPTLAGIVGRPSASLENFTYTSALKSQTFIWDEENLDQWLSQPQAMVPGMCLPFMGLSKKEDRVSFIEYLKNPTN